MATTTATVATPAARQLFVEAFDAELAEQRETADLPSSEWRAGGKRVTKANPNPTGEDEAWWRANGPGMVQSWIDWRRTSKWRTADLGGQPAIELGITTTVADMPLKMYIDRVMVIPQSEQLCIVDLKTGARSPESDMQLGVYRKGLLETFPGIQVDFGAYWMARKGQLSEIVNLTRYTPEMLGRWFTRLKAAIANEVFIPHVTNMCRPCGMREYCTAYGGSKAHLDPDSHH